MVDGLVSDPVGAWLDGVGAEPARAEVAQAVRRSLRALAQLVPGAAVEVRVPPFAAVQCIAGPRHTRGTPPNVVETDPRTWLQLATARITWPTAIADGRVRASGPRADLSPWLPLPHSAGSAG
ncbi:MAG: sterol carrier family protein [Pseudonocardia sp.]|nr:sterol carrier family protein [Pseudonocardia sp.]